MDPTALKEKLIGVLRQVQIESGLECPSLSGTTKPIEKLPEFDSIVWPVATTMLATEIGMSIPNDVNIFVDKMTKLPHSIDETTAIICDLLRKQGDRKAA